MTALLGGGPGGADRLLELVPGVRARGVVGVGGALGLFADHFPVLPVLPGVLLLDRLAALAGLVEAGDGPRPALHLAEATRVQFRAPVRPGDVVELVVERTGPLTCRAEAQVDGRLVARVARLRLERLEPPDLGDVELPVDGEAGP